MDSAVIVDIYRGYENAVAWLNANSHLQLGISSVVWMEWVFGAQNKHRQRAVLKFLTLFSVVYLTQADQMWAMQQLQKYRLSHNVDVPDCLRRPKSSPATAALYAQPEAFYTAAGQSGA